MSTNVGLYPGHHELSLLYSFEEYRFLFSSVPVCVFKTEFRLLGFNSNCELWCLRNSSDLSIFSLLGHLRFCPPCACFRHRCEWGLYTGFGAPFLVLSFLLFLSFSNGYCCSNLWSLDQWVFSWRFCCHCVQTGTYLYTRIPENILSANSFF